MHFSVSIEIIPFYWYLIGDGFFNSALFCDLYFQSFLQNIAKDLLRLLTR